MAKEKERFNQDEEKAPTASDVLASAAAALTTSAAALTSSAATLISAARALTSAADALTSYASTSDDDAVYPSSEEDSDDDHADLQGEDDPTKEGVLKLFREFQARRNGILKALTTDVEKFHSLCDPDKEELCLYGHVDGTWVVTDPVKMVPPDMPEPTVGFNFIRDHLNRKEWLARVAMHSEAWLYRTTFYKRHNLEDKSRIELFSMINNLPTIHEAVMEAANKPSNESTPRKSIKRNKSASELMPPPKRTPEAAKMKK